MSTEHIIDLWCCENYGPTDAMSNVMYFVSLAWNRSISDCLENAQWKSVHDLHNAITMKYK